VTLDREAFPFLAVLGLSAIPVLVWIPYALFLLAPLLLFTLWFFRDPNRVPPTERGIVLSPADGRILRSGPSGISIFLNVFDVHVCRTPIGGRVVSVDHVAGRFLAAFKAEASEQNERAEILVEGADGVRMRFVLVAGLVARRIVCRVNPGRTLAAGERVGIIRFGSRVDLVLPEGFAPAVGIGDRVTAGETVLARRGTGAST
jgi:phosphatidylserine decarboxylase